MAQEKVTNVIINVISNIQITLQLLISQAICQSKIGPTIRLGKNLFLLYLSDVAEYLHRW